MQLPALMHRCHHRCDAQNRSNAPFGAQFMPVQHSGKPVDLKIRPTRNQHREPILRGIENEGSRGSGESVRQL